MSNILCIETSIGKCSVAFKHNDSEDYIEVKERSMQSEQLFVLIKKILKRNNLGFEDLNIIGCTLGPGSFTGVRIGLAAVCGIQKVLTDIRLLGVSTLEVIASTLRFPIVEKKLLVVLNAYGGDLYAQEFDSDGNPLGSIYLISQQALRDKLEDTLLVTEQSSFNHEQSFVVNLTAQDLLKKIHRIILEGKESLYEELLPMYIKGPNITAKS